MEIPASYLFDTEKFKRFISYSRITNIVSNNALRIVNDIGCRGDILDGGIISLNTNHDDVTELSEYNLEVYVGDDYEDVYIPRVSNIKFVAAYSRPMNIRRLFIQPGEWLRYEFVHSLRSVVNINKFYCKDVGLLSFTKSDVRELNLFSSERVAVTIQKGFNHESIEKIQADDNTLVIRKAAIQLGRYEKKEICEYLGISDESNIWVKRKSLYYDGNIITLDKLPTAIWNILKDNELCSLM